MSIGPTGPKGGFGAQGFRGEKGSIGPTGPSIDPAIINSKAPLNNPKFTGTVQGISQTMVGLGNVDNTSDADKQISTATQNALDLKAPIDNPKFTGTVEGVTKAMVGLGNVDNTSDVDKPVSQATKAALDFKAPLDNPKFTGTVEGVTKAMVELGNVDNTSDADKQISTATQTALNLKANSSDVTNSLAFKADKTYVDSKISNLVGDVSDSLDTLKEISQALDNDPNLYVTLKGMIDLKAPINNPKFTGTVEGVTKAMVELGNVNNTSDADKQISTATQTALNLKAPLASPAFSTDVSINGLTFGKGNNNIDSNTAGGLNVLKNNTTGTGNSAFGVESLKSNQTGNWNTSFGYSSLVNNISGSKNTSVGFNSLTYNTSSNNTAIGQNSLWSNTSGSNNTALGNSSGMSNTTGLNNTYIGYNSDCSGNNLTNSTAIGANAKVTESNQIVLGGNNSGYPIVNIPGTLYVSGSSKLSSVSTSEALQIKGQFEKNKYAMNITDDTSGNFISYWPNIYGGSNNYMAQIGDNLLYMGNNDSSGTSSSCVITKWSSVCSGLRWDKNTRLYLGMGGTSVIPSNSIIFNAVDNTDASANSITMYTNSVKRMTISNSGLATLSNGLVVGTTDVIASLAAKAPLASPAFSTDVSINGLTVGRGSGNSGLNTAVGVNALNNNTSGTYNVANGNQSLFSNTNGSYNTAHGYYSLGGNTSGSNNISLGTNSGSTNTTGSNNTYLGTSSGCNSNNLTNSTALGYNAKVTKSYQIVLGDASVTEVSIPGTAAKLLVGTTDVTTSLAAKANSSDVTTFLAAKANLANPAFSTDAVINGLTVGKGSGNVNTNTSIGLSSLSLNQTGYNNTAVGYYSLRQSTGTANTALGESSLTTNTSGSQNTANGAGALATNISGNHNTANGFCSLYTNKGSFNTTLGYYSGFNNNNNSNNTYIGYNSDCSGNVTNSTALGSNAKVTKSQQIVLGDASVTEVSIPGTAARLLVGTTDVIASINSKANLSDLAAKANLSDLESKANLSDLAAKADINYVDTQISDLVGGAPQTLNTLKKISDALGENANLSVTLTTLIGEKANSSDLESKANLSDLEAKANLANPAFTTDALINGLTVGKGSGNVDSNTAVGYKSLLSNTTGIRNTANGCQSLLSNTTGVRNTANGYQSLLSNTTGIYNTAFGYQSLLSNTTGVSNTAIGYQSLLSNTDGYENIANGYKSLRSNTTGCGNIAIGGYSLVSNTTGGFNIATGHEAGSNNMTGFNNTYLGFFSNCTENNLSNSTAIGAQTYITKSNQIVLGNASVTEVSIPGTAARLLVGTTDVIASLNAKANLSDLELKANLSDLESKANLSDLEAKANLSDLAAKADITYVEEKISDLVGAAPTTLNTLKEISDALGENANLSVTLTTLIGEKADFSYVTTALESKANSSDVTTALESKANLSDLELKANLSDLAAKANLSDLEAKANLSDLAAKANSSDVTTALESKANSSDLAAKANLSDLDAKADITVKAINSKYDLDLSGCYPINLSNGTCMLINNFPTILPNLNGAVYAMCSVGPDLYIGGAFTTVRQTNGNILTVNRICRYSTLDGTYSAMGSGVSSGNVNALCVMGGTDLYIGGNFISAGSITSANICNYSLSTNQYSAMGAGVNNTVNALCAIGTNLYIGGEFLTFNNNDGVGNITTNRICRYNTTNKFTNMGIGVDNIVYALCAINSDLYIGGAFTTTNGNIATYGICKYNTSTASFSRISATSNSTGVSGTVFAMCPVENTDIYVGGNFMSFNNSTTNIAAYFVCKYNISSSTFSVLAGSGSGFAAQVRTLSFVGTDLYIGGDFQFYNNGTGNISANRICKYNPSSRTFSSAFTVSGNNGIGGNVHAITFVGNNLYIGGNFTSALGVSCGYFFYMKSLALEIKYNSTSLGFMLNNTFEPITSMTYNNKKYFTFMGSKYII